MKILELIKKANLLERLYNDIESQKKVAEKEKKERPKSSASSSYFIKKLFKQLELFLIKLYEIIQKINKKNPLFSRHNLLSFPPYYIWQSLSLHPFNAYIHKSQFSEPSSNHPIDQELTRPYFQWNLYFSLRIEGLEFAEQIG